MNIKDEIKILNYGMKLQEEKLKEIMPEEEFKAFCEFVAKEMFRKEIEGMKDGSFKKFVQENFGEITQ